MNYLKRLAREEQNALQKKMQEQFDIELKNNKSKSYVFMNFTGEMMDFENIFLLFADEIENLKLQLKELGVKPVRSFVDSSLTLT